MLKMLTKAEQAAAGWLVFCRPGVSAAAALAPPAEASALVGAL